MGIKRNKNLMSRNITYIKRSKSDIEYIVVHYVGALGDAYDNTEYYKNTDVNASADFWVGHDGAVWQGNDYYKSYSWHCGGGRQSAEGGTFYGICKNSNSIGIEMCVKKKSTKTMNATDIDWYFTNDTIEATAELIKELMAELEIDADHVIRHFDVTGKYCPNPFLDKYHPEAWGAFKKKFAPASSADYPNPQSADPNIDNVWMGWTKRETGSAGLRCIHGDNGKAYGLQFDYRYGLVPFMQYCVDYNPERYKGFNYYIQLGAASPALVYNAGLGKLWQEYYDKYTDEFCQLQLTKAYQSYYLEAKKYINNLYGIDMDKRRPAVKGSLFSMAFRSGALSAAKKFNGCSESSTDLEMINTAYATYGSEDANRWTMAGQWGDAVAALKSGEYTELQKAIKATAKVEEKKEETDSTPSSRFSVRVSISDLNIRTGAGVGYATTGFYTGVGTFTIVETKKGAINSAGTLGTWGRLLSGAGWICLSVDGVAIVS